MSDTKRAFKQIRDLSRAAAVAGHSEASLNREIFFTSLAHKIMLRTLGARQEFLTSRRNNAPLAFGVDDRYREVFDTLPESCLDDPTFLGWAYQIWNEPLRDANSWAVSKRSENRHEGVDIAAVTQVFTDRYIADFLISRCVDLWCVSPGRDGVVPRVCDPALGTGHILVAAVRALVARGFSAHVIASRLFGFDIDSLSVFVARTAVFCELIRSGYSEEPAVLWESLGCTLQALPAPYGSLDRSIVFSGDVASFDIIVTNPPYLGSRKLPGVVRGFLEQEYPATCVDLCAAFLQRCIELLSAGGTLGVVTSDKWIRLQRYSPVRTGGRDFKGLFGELTIDGIYELGERAFSTVSDLHDGMRAALLVGCKVSPSASHQLAYVNLSEISSYSKKQEALCASMADGASLEHVSRVRQSELAKGGAVFLKLSGLPSQLSNLAKRVSDHADIVVGVQTNDDAKFIKYVWQVQGDRSGWRVHSKGGGYGRWAGLNRWVIDWGWGADQFLGRESARERAESWAAQEGWVYSWFANGSLGLRRKEAGWTFGRAASGGVFTKDPRVVAFMNSRLASAVARSVGGKIQLPEGTVKAIPTPVTFDRIDDELVTGAVSLKQTLVASDPTEALFRPHTMLTLEEQLLIEALLLVVEGKLEQQVEQSVGLSSEERMSLVGRLGMVAGWFSLRGPLESHPVLDRIPQQMRAIIKRCFAQPPEVCLSGRLRPSIEVLQQIGDLRKLDGMVDSRWLLPSTGLVETICRAFHLHPFDALLTAEELLQLSVGIRRRVCGDYVAKRVSVQVLGRLGHRWWSESEASEGRCDERISFDEVCSIVEAVVPDSGYAGVYEAFGMPLDAWVQRVFPEFNQTYFCSQSPLVFEQSSGRFGAVTRAAVQ